MEISTVNTKIDGRSHLKTKNCNGQKLLIWRPRLFQCFGQKVFENLNSLDCFLLVKKIFQTVQNIDLDQ